MTTIVVVRKGLRACIAADTLAKYGSAKEPASFVFDSDKLVPVGNAWLGPTGPASAQLVLKSYFSQPDVRADFTSSLGIFETVNDMQSALKEDYFLNPKEDERDPFESSQMEILIASPSGIFGVYPLRSVQEFTRFGAFGSGAEYALGALQACYDAYDRPEDIARKAIESSATFDDSTGLPITCYGIDLLPSANGL